MNIIVLNGFGTNGGEIKYLVRRLKKETDHNIIVPTNIPGSFSKELGKFPAMKSKHIEDFINETSIMISNLKDETIIIAYSVGVLFAGQIMKRVTNVSRMVLIAPVIKSIGISKFALGFGKSFTHISEDSRIQKYFYNTFVTRLYKVPKINLVRILKHMGKCKNNYKEINVPVLLIETLKDEIIKKSSIEWLIKEIGVENVTRFPVEAPHILFYDRTSRKIVTDKIIKYIDEVKNSESIDELVERIS